MDLLKIPSDHNPFIMSTELQTQDLFISDEFIWYNNNW